ncbi:MAG: SUMF1/EgtB/PvdO family nonheme iron enzyme [Chthoniobacter sp.]|nr:SUMF1/EgtB/PvdO family nonheme iron enzyme [Chthoniobacter sp.]
MSQPEKFEHYELLKNDDGSFVELGHGAMGLTYKAFDTNLRCAVALKVISAAYLGDPTAAERFLREARGAAQLRHRNVASVFHLGRHGDSYFYSMEFIEGETLDALVKREGPLDPVAALEITAQVASALIAAHKQGLVHRDIKPSNLMLIREGDGEMIVKVIDFGLVKSALIGSTAGALTSTGFVGTPYFASPEQLDQRSEDIRSDIYSLGVTLWFMLTGQPTFRGSVASVIAQHLDKSPEFESLAVLPAGVVAVLRRMLEKDVDLRMQTPADLRLELRRCLESLPAKPSPSADTALETVALSSARGLTTPRVADDDFSTVPRPLATPPAAPDPAANTLAEPSATSAARTLAGASAVHLPTPVSKKPIVAVGIALLVLLAAGAALIFHQPAAEKPAAQPPATPAVKPIAAAPRLPPKPGKPWKNSLDMRYVPVGEIWFATTETRVRDFDAFVQARGYDATGGMYSLQRDGFKDHRHTWQNPGFPQSPEHPVVGVSWDDAKYFCDWLTAKERGEGALTAAQFYRLPTDREWSEAAGLPSENGATPEERSGKAKGVYPWGKTWPPPENAGNYAGTEAKPGAPDNWPIAANLRDAFPRTCAVPGHVPNALGISDLGGNVWEWCADTFNKTSKWRTLRGGAWSTSRPDEILTSFRRPVDPSFRHDDIGFRCVIATDDGTR